jgi:DNA-binding transcriptional ArsR family regulator
VVTERLARTGSAFGAIADPTRRAILDLLRSKEQSAGELARHFPVSRPAISRHVRVLRSAGLIRTRREAQLRIYGLEPARLADVDAWLAPYKLFWASRP